MYTRITVLVALASLLCSSLAIAAPTRLNQQGRLLDGDGAPMTGSHGLAFTLHDAETDGNEVWREERLVQFEEGYYSIVLGELVPLSDLVFAAGPVWLELNVDGAVLSPRHEVVSVPYALRAAVAESLEGSTVDVDEVSIGGNVVIDGSGNWLGTPPDWSDLTGVPPELADGDADTDTLLGLPCADGYVAKYSTSLGAWDCAQDNDNQLSESQVEGYITNGAIDLAAGSSMAGSALATLGDLATSTDWSTLTSIPANVAQLILDGDNNTDTLGGLVCLDGELARWDDVLGLWTCDTDSVLSETDVEAFVTNGAIDLAAGTTIGGVPIAASGSASFQTSGQVTLTSLNSVTLTPAGPLPQFTHSAWLDVAGAWRPVPYRGDFEICGDGSDGTFTATPGNMTIPGGVYNYTDFNLPVGTTLTVTGSDPLVIRAQNTLVVDGEIMAAGGNASVTTGGVGGPGGTNGGPGSCSACAGWSGGNHGAAGAMPTATCDEPEQGGRPGGGGWTCLSWASQCNPASAKGGGGGGGGGLIILQARHVEISGTIDVGGGNGAVNQQKTGGGGSGGIVFIEASGIDLAASAFFNLAGGTPAAGFNVGSGIGSDGRLILKGRSSTYPISVTYLTYFDECLADSGIPPEVSTYFDPTGLHIRNFGIDPVDVVLNLSE
jgi:hypothetical protein